MTDEISRESCRPEAKRLTIEYLKTRSIHADLSELDRATNDPLVRDALQEQKRIVSQVRKASECSELLKTQSIDQIGFDPSAIAEEVAKWEAKSDVRITVDLSKIDLPSNNETMVVHSVPQSEEVIQEGVSAGEPALVYRPTHRPPTAALKVYVDGKRHLAPFPIFRDSFVIGRTNGDLLVQNDTRISGRHVEIQRRRKSDRYAWYLVDLDSTNGVFVRVEHAVLYDGDQIQLGAGRYRFINRDNQLGIVSVTNDSSDIWLFPSSVVYVGRDTPDALPSIRSDPFVDPSHAIFRTRAGKWMVLDNDSINGVWFRIRKEVQLTRNCQFLIGEQMFGFQIL